jgi:hypothetical protein
MKKVLIGVVAVLVVFGICFAAAPSRVAVDNAYSVGVVKYEAGYQPIQKYYKFASDTALGSSASKSILKNFIPAPGWEYIIARDTLSATVRGGTAMSRDTRVIIGKVTALDSAGSIVGSVNFDTITTGSAVQQMVVPFGSAIVGDKYNVDFVNTSATDSLIYNHVRLYKRRPVSVTAPANW